MDFELFQLYLNSEKDIDMNIDDMRMDLETSLNPFQSEDSLPDAIKRMIDLMREFISSRQSSCSPSQFQLKKNIY